MARSILSFGMFSWRAAMTAARSRGFIAGSGVPSLAATVISRASLPNSFDFWASCLPLRCMMFLNWEWPAIGVSWGCLGGFLEISWRFLWGLFGGLQIRSASRGKQKARRYRPCPSQNQRFGNFLGVGGAFRPVGIV